MKDFEQAKARGSAPDSTDLRALQVALIGYGEVGTPRRARADRVPGADDREEGRSTESAGGTAA